MFYCSNSILYVENRTKEVLYGKKKEKGQKNQEVWQLVYKAEHCKKGRGLSGRSFYGPSGIRRNICSCQAG